VEGRALLKDNDRVTAKPALAGLTGSADDAKGRKEEPK
jgi:hypothetical protein